MYVRRQGFGPVFFLLLQGRAVKKLGYILLF